MDETGKTCASKIIKVAAAFDIVPGGIHTDVLGLPALKIGGQFRIKTESFVKWLDTCEKSYNKGRLDAAFAALDY